MAVFVGNSKTEYEMTISGDAKDVRINVGDGAIAASKTQTREVMDTVGKTASKLIESGGDILTAPAVWLKNIQANWSLYIIVVAIILLCIVFLYCTVRYHLNQKKNIWSVNNLTELAQVIGNAGNALQRQIPLPTNNLLCRPSNSVIDSNV